MSTLKSAHRRACMTTTYVEINGIRRAIRHFSYSLKYFARQQAHDPPVRNWAANKGMRL